MAVAGPGKGNRRRGAVKGRSGLPGQRRWQDDREVLDRISMVIDPALSEQPLTVIHDRVNAALVRDGREPVSFRTIRLDVERAKELYRERVVNGAEARMAQLQQLWAATWKSIGKTPEGPARAPLLAVALRTVEDQAKLDGSWGAIREPALPFGSEDISFGPSPQELLDSGEISREDYRAWLLVLHRHSGGQGARPVNGRVVEGKALPEPSSNGPQLRRGGSNGRPPTPPPAMPSMGDDLPNIVDWNEDD